MSERETLQRDLLLRAMQDVLNDIALKIGELPARCTDCPVYSGLSEFAAKLRKAGLQEEAEIVQSVRERYNI